MEFKSTKSTQLHLMEDAVAGVQWSTLPPEIWAAIGKRLYNHIDAVRFRSVCRLWRTSLPSIHDISPPVRPQFPSPIRSANLSIDAFLYQPTVYRLAPIDDESTFHSSFPRPHRKGWLVKVEKIEVGKMRLLHPLFKRHIRSNFESLPMEQRELNLLDLRIDELAKSYSLKYTEVICVPGISKLVLFSNSALTDTDVNNFTVIAVYEEGKLGFARCGDEKWTLIDDQNFHYDDVIRFKGQYYAVDRWGTVFWIDSSMKLVQFYPPLCGFGSQKHLVECGGELYVIDRYLDRDRLFWNPADEENVLPYVIPVRRPRDSIPKVIDFKVFKLDEEWGRWIEVNNLGNHSIILGNDCSFSVSASEFEGCKRNCIYFTDVNDDEHPGRDCCRVFDLKARRMGNIQAHPAHQIEIFRPSPIWLSKSSLLP